MEYTDVGREWKLSDELDLNEIANTNLESEYNVNWLGIILSIATILFIMTLPIFATFDDANSNIMYVIESPMLRGRNDLVARYGTLVAFLAQAIITACGLFIISLKTVTIAFTVLYLTHPTMWNRVNTYVTSKKSEGGDWFTVIVAWLVPNVKQLSEYADGDEHGTGPSSDMFNSEGVYTIPAYVKSKAWDFVLIVTLAAVLWNGKLLLLVGKISEGCVAIVDVALKVDYGGQVRRLLEADRSYVFMYDRATVSGRNQQSFANALYSQMRTAVPDNNTSEFFNMVGVNIDGLISELNLAESSDKDTGLQPHVRWDNPTLSISMTWNSQKPDKDTNTVEWKHGILQIPMSVILDDDTGKANKTTRQMQMEQNGIVYVSFTAQPTWNPADYETTEKKDDEN